MLTLPLVATGSQQPLAACFRCKMRGISFRGGFHDFTIERGGLAVYPRLVAAEHHKSFEGAFTPSGNAEDKQGTLA
jgi:hypothetical protein